MLHLGHDFLYVSGRLTGINSTLKFSVIFMGVPGYFPWRSIDRESVESMKQSHFRNAVI